MLQKKIILLICIIVLSMTFSGCGLFSEKEPANDNKQTESFSYETDNPIVAIDIKDRGTIVIELYPDIAPNTVNNFISLVNEGFYDGLIFHRVIPGFMVQGGCPNKNGTGNPGYSIKGEFSQNGFNNSLKHTRGVLSMARSQHNDSAGSQFFIMVADAPHLDQKYASFGKVVYGMEIVDAIVSVSRNSSDKPDKDQIITKATVMTSGNYEKPETIK